VGAHFTSSEKASSVPGRMHTAVVESSGAANPRVPVLKLTVLSLSPTLAGRDLTWWRLKSHMGRGTPQTSRSPRPFLLPEPAQNSNLATRRCGNRAARWGIASAQHEPEGMRSRAMMRRKLLLKREPRPSPNWGGAFQRHSNVSCGDWSSSGLVGDACADVRQSLRRQESPRFCADPGMIRRRRIGQHHCSLCAGRLLQRERLWWSRTASLNGLAPLPRQRLVGLRGVWVVAARVAPARVRGIFLHLPAKPRSVSWVSSWTG